MAPKFPGAWVVKEREKELTRPPSMRDITDPEEEFIDVRFRGRVKTIWIHVSEGEQMEERAAETLGRIIKELIVLPGGKAVFDGESLSFEKPLGPHLPLLLGVPFYAAVSTTDVEIARKMAVDRIVYAISAVRCKHPEKAKEILKKHKMEMTTK
jgi:hypothetical protein